MYLASLSTAVPPHSYTQQSCWDSMAASPLMKGLKPRSSTLLEKILTGGTSGIQRRSLALDRIEDSFDRSAEALNRDFEKEAPKLAAAAILSALEKAGISPEKVDALFLCTCTGYLCPGPSSHVAELTGMRDDVYLMDLVGLGCGAAIPLLRTAHGFLAANPDAIVVTVAVEICSAAFFADDDPGVLISLSLFGDGAAAAVWTGRSIPGAWKADNFSTLHRPAHREKVRFINSGGKLKNQLHRAVPGIAGEAVAELFAKRSSDPDQVLAHSGGRDVIEALEAVLPYRLTETRDVLSAHGNMSSPSVLFALKNRLVEERTTDRKLWLTAFGAGFSAHACELHR